MDLKKIEDLLTPPLEDKGIAWVDAFYFQQGTGHVLDIRLERLDRAPFTVADARSASRLISTLLDVEEAITGRYTLEVGSAGLDRPLKKFDDFKRFKGSAAKIETRDLIENRRRFTGTIESAENNSIKIKTEEGLFDIPFETIEKARLSV